MTTNNNIDKNVAINDGDKDDETTSLLLGEEEKKQTCDDGNSSKSIFSYSFGSSNIIIAVVVLSLLLVAVVVVGSFTRSEERTPLSLSLSLSSSSNIDSTVSLLQLRTSQVNVNADCSKEGGPCYGNSYCCDGFFCLGDTGAGGTKYCHADNGLINKSDLNPNCEAIMLADFRAGKFHTSKVHPSKEFDGIGIQDTWKFDPPGSNGYPVPKSEQLDGHYTCQDFCESCAGGYFDRCSQDGAWNCKVYPAPDVDKCYDPCYTKCFVACEADVFTCDHECRAECEYCQN